MGNLYPPPWAWQLLSTKGVSDETAAGWCVWVCFLCVCWRRERRWKACGTRWTSTFHSMTFGIMSERSTQSVRSTSGLQQKNSFIGFRFHIVRNFICQALLQSQKRWSPVIWRSCYTVRPCPTLCPWEDRRVSWTSAKTVHQNRCRAEADVRVRLPSFNADMRKCETVDFFNLEKQFFPLKYVTYAKCNGFITVIFELINIF